MAAASDGEAVAMVEAAEKREAALRDEVTKLEQSMRSAAQRAAELRARR